MSLMEERNLGTLGGSIKSFKFLKYFKTILIYSAVVIITYFLLLGRKTILQYYASGPFIPLGPVHHSNPNPSSNKDGHLWHDMTTVKKTPLDNGPEIDNSRWHLMDTQKKKHIKKGPNIDSSRGHTMTTQKYVDKGLQHKDAFIWHGMTTQGKRSKDIEGETATGHSTHTIPTSRGLVHQTLSPNEDNPRPSLKAAYKDKFSDKEGQCLNDSGKMTQEILEKIFRYFRLTKLTITGKQCTKCGAIVNITVPSTSPPYSQFCTTVEVLSKSVPECRNEIISKNMALLLERELGLNYSAPATWFHLNDSYFFDSQLRNIVNGCVTNQRYHLGLIFGIFQSSIGKMSNSQGFPQKGLENIRLSTQESVNHLIFLYLGHCLTSGWSSRDTKDDKQMDCLILHRHLGLANNSWTPKPVLFRKSVLCNMHPKLLDTLQTMDAITSHEPSLGTKMKLRIGEIMEGKERAPEDSIVYEEIDGRVAELLQQHRVSKIGTCV